MAVTTRKAFTDAVRKHIEEILSTDHTTDLQEQLQNVVNGFHNWYTKYEQKVTPNYWDALKSWFMGLPSEINVEYRHFESSELLKQWIEVAGEVYKERKNEHETYLHLVSREFAALCRLHKIEVFK